MLASTLWLCYHEAWYYADQSQGIYSSFQIYWRREDPAMGSEIGYAIVGALILTHLITGIVLYIRAKNTTPPRED